jgi:hypothetical protein
MGQLDYALVDIPGEIISEVDNIVASISRTGAPIQPPGPTPTLFPPTPLPPTIFPPTPTVQSLCNAAKFIADVSIPDGMNFAPGTRFIKIWRLENTGSCTWNTNYSLAFSGGERMGNSTEIMLPHNVHPGERVDISVNLTAPMVPDHYRGYWMLKNSSGKLFGFGEFANKAIYVDIYTADSSSSGVSGKICFPSEHIPAMALYLQNMDNNKLTEIAINEMQLSYSVQISPGTYLAYAWTTQSDLGGGYTDTEHYPKPFTIQAGKTTTGIDCTSSDFSDTYLMEAFRLAS